LIENEVDLVRRCLNQDESGMRGFIDQFQGMIFGLCFRMLGHREDAEDVTQEVFLRVFRNLHRWDQKRPLKPWLMTITSNRCRTALEKRNRRPSQTEFISDITSEEVRGNPVELAEELQLAIDKLREEYRLCFTLFYQQEFSCVEIAEILDCPEGTVKTWLHRARNELANHLRRRGINPKVEHELHRI